jgi:hypothetical protein
VTISSLRVLRWIAIAVAIAYVIGLVLVHVAVGQLGLELAARYLHRPASAPLPYDPDEPSFVTGTIVCTFDGGEIRIYGLHGAPWHCEDRGR